MESNSVADPDSPSAQASLDALATDRRQLAIRAKAPSWFYPTLGLLTAGIIATPVIGDMAWTFSALAAACLGLLTLEHAYRRRTGLSTNRVPGPRTLGILIGMGALVLLLVSVSGWLTSAGQSVWVVAPAAVGFLTMFPGGLLYDRAYGTELVRGI
jgi:hypothetical protein